MGNIINFLEHRTGLVHADSGDGTDYTLCGVTKKQPEEDAESLVRHRNRAKGIDKRPPI